MELTFRQYLSKLAVIAACYLLIPLLFFGWCANASTIMSFIGSSSCFLIITTISACLLFPDYVTRKFYVVCFFVLLIIGVLHYLLFVDPQYFAGSGGPSLSFWHEFQTTFGSLERLVNGKINNGLFYTIPKEEYGTTHIELYSIITIPYVSLGVKWLNFAPLNVFSALLTSMNLLSLSKIKEFDIYVQKMVMYFSAFFPTFLLCDLLWRDPFGIALISCACMLCVISEYKRGSFFLSLILLLCCGYLLRTMYPVAILMGCGFFMVKKSNTRGTNYILLLFFAIAALVLFRNILSDNEVYVDSYAQWNSPFSLPLRFLFSIVGPFPWSLFLTYVQTPSASFYLSEMVAGVLMVACFLAILSNLRMLTITEDDFVAIVGFSIILTAFMSGASHSGYVSEGLIFAMPWLLLHIRENIYKYLRISFTIFIVANILVGVVGHLGLRSLFF